MRTLLDSPDQARETALWVQARLQQPGVTLLFSNHDMAYAFNEEVFPFLACSGFRCDKAEAIAAVLRREHWAQLKAYSSVGPWLVSYAGFHRDLLSHELVRDRAALHARCQQALLAVSRQQGDPVFAVGRERGGRADVGGITWCDWKRFEAIEGVHQIVGHTPNTEEALRHWSPPWSTNYCIDHRNGHTYAVVSDRSTLFHCFQKWKAAVVLARVEHEALERATERSAAGDSPEAI